MIENYCIFPEDNIHRAIACINDNQKGIALVVNEKGQLLGTITDGDIRRAILADLDMSGPVRPLLKRKPGSPYPQPVTAHINMAPDVLLAIMQEKMVRQIPLLNDDGRVAGLVTLDELTPLIDLPLQAVVMAGGKGMRLRPLTEDLPKPMLPVGGKPLLERIIKQLRNSGVRHVNVTTYYKPEKIMEYFGDGQKFGVSLNYVNENTPLGTGGALALMPRPKESLLVINGDILTQVNIKALRNFHQDQQALMTVAVRRYEVQVPYGVVESDGAYVTQLHEKPQMVFFVNAGIYLLEPEVFDFMPQDKNFNMTDLIQWLLDAEKSVVSFPISEYWLDIGQHSDYIQAQDDVLGGKVAE